MKFDNYKTKTDLILPFIGEWVVFNGGKDASTNDHRTEDNTGPANQTFAYDFVKEHTESKRLEDYGAFGAEVLAPGDGKVVQVINGSFDVPIGETDWIVLCGNAITIDHLNGEFSTLAHLKHNSIKVRVGEMVHQGDVIAACGNSGNTSEPHIHYHLQDSLYQHTGNGLPAQFRKILIDGQEILNAEPIRDQKVSN